jgi:signal transduction histidine kinase
VNAIAADSHGGVWLNDTQEGLWKWSRGRLEPLSLPAPLKRANADVVFADRTDRIWLGFVEGGCAVYDGATYHIYEPADGLAFGPVTSFFEDQEGVLWISAVNGLTRLKDGRLLTATRKNGLLGNVLTGVIGDGQDGLWVGSNAGILRVLRTDFDRLAHDSERQLQIALFASPEGLSGNPVTLGSPEVTRASDGNIWFPTTAGIAIVNPARTTKARIAPAVTLESAVMDDKPVAMIAGQRLPPNTSRIEIDFTALSFLAPSRIRFRYRLDDFDRDWVDAGRRRRAVYTSLPPGTYRFRVMAANDDMWSEAPEGWKFSIEPTFYQTRSFLMASVAGVLVLAWLASHVRSRQVRARFFVIMEERARVGREIHDTLLQMMTGLALEVHAAAVALGPTQDAMKRRLLQLRDKTQESIRETRQSIWDLRLPNPIKEEDQQLVAALRKTSESIIPSANDVQFEFVATGTPYRKPDLDEQLFRLGQEAIRNAVAHAKASRIRVELNYDRDSIVLRVTDNGCGFELPAGATRSSLHWGLAIMEERARKIGADFRLVTRPGEGTMVEAVAKL